MGGLNIRLGSVQPSPISIAIARSSIGLRGKDVSLAQPITALDWDGAGTPRRMLYWDNPFPLYGSVDGITVFMDVYLRPQFRTGGDDRYWANWFWGNSDNDDSSPPGTLFAWDGGQPNTYAGYHLYPVDGLDPFTTDDANFEISINSNDYLGPMPTWNRWYRQAWRQWRESAALTHHEFYWDWDLWVSSGGTQGLLSQDINDTGWADTNPPIPRITIGQAAWLDRTTHEESNARIRRIRQFDRLLNVGTHIPAEMAGAAGASGFTPWYANDNPTSADVTDKSGSGHHPQWRGQAAPTWQGAQY